MIFEIWISMMHRSGYTSPRMQPKNCEFMTAFSDGPRFSTQDLKYVSNHSRRLLEHPCTSTFQYRGLLCQSFKKIEILFR